MKKIDTKKSPGTSANAAAGEKKIVTKPAIVAKLATSSGIKNGKPNQPKDQKPASKPAETKNSKSSSTASNKSKSSVIDLDTVVANAYEIDYRAEENKGKKWPLVIDNESGDFLMFLNEQENVNYVSLNEAESLNAETFRTSLIQSIRFEKVFVIGR